MNVNFGTPKAPQENIPRYKDAGKKLGRTALLVFWRRW